MANVLQEAISLRMLGFAVHWLQMGTKFPVATNWANGPVMSVSELRQTYRPGFNLGFRAGRWSVVRGKEVCVLDIDIRGGPQYQAEAYAAAATMLGGTLEPTVISGSGVGRHVFLGCPIGCAPSKAATILRESDVWIDRDGKVCLPGTDGARRAWMIELLSTGKNVVLPPSIHPDTQQPYQWA